MRITGTHSDGRVIGGLSQHKQSDSISASLWILIVLLHAPEYLSPVHAMVAVGSSSDAESSGSGERAFDGPPANFEQRCQMQVPLHLHASIQHAPLETHHVVLLLRHLESPG